MSPLITLKEHEQLHQARSAQETRLECSLDLQRSTTVVEIMDDHWRWNGRAFPYLNKCKARTVYYWDGSNFLPAARYSDALIKLVPTDWGPPTFEIDGIKMLCTETISPHEDARRKVLLV